PLLHKDMEVIHHHADEVLKGLSAVLAMTGAREAIIGIKDKHEREITLLTRKAPAGVRVVPIEDVYPAGDEITLIYMTTGRLVQPGALPITAGCLVQNVETLYNIGAGRPVTDKFLSVAGAVEHPATVRVPVGVSYAEVLSRFRITEPDYRVRSGGLMMGILEDDLTQVVSKRTGALIVLPADHYCVTMYRRFTTDHDTDRIAKAGCDQCSFCTELCPRYLLGQPVRPETAMRNRMFTREDQPMLFAGNLSCCECNLCTMYSCPEGLDPRGATVIEKRAAREQKLTWSGPGITAHPMYEYRKVPSAKLRQRLDVVRFADEGPLVDLALEPEEVRIPLHEHAGAAAEAAVKRGQSVRRGDLVGRARGRISSNVHASIDGTVAAVSADHIHIRRT
ncbi:MAG TPA: 4Fe-4S dicluster domain-containing protein, partial [Bacteroidota bacterium]|nr:4Fe-4S dicluster domain-containing protein [Bacteroidota bacterium]